MNSIRLETALMVAMFAAGCACEHGIGLTGDQDADLDADLDASEETSQGSWDPPIENLGEPGWRDSTVPFCRDPEWELGIWDLWSDYRGVFVIVTEQNPGPTSYPPSGPDEAHARYFLLQNDGTGWNRYLEDIAGPEIMTCFMDLTGIPGGILLPRSSSDLCEVHLASDGPFVLEPFAAHALFVVDETLAYALLLTGLLARFDGVSWGPYPSDPPPYGGDHLWADRSCIFLAGRTGIIMSEEDGAWRVHDSGTLEDITSLWGFSENDVWAGTQAGHVIHWDGETWTDQEWPSHVTCTGNKEIRGMWGDDGVLFFHTRWEIVTWDDAEFRNILSFPCDPLGQDVLAIWGNGPDEVFVSVWDATASRSGCDDWYMMWWDGHEFHWF